MHGCIPVVQNVFTPHKPGTAKPRVLATLQNTLELGKNGRKTVPKTIPVDGNGAPLLPLYC